MIDDDKHTIAAREWLRHWSDGGKLLAGAEHELAHELRAAAAADAREERARAVRVVDPKTSNISWRTVNAYTCLAAAAHMIQEGIDPDPEWTDKARRARVRAAGGKAK